MRDNRFVCSALYSTRFGIKHWFNRPDIWEHIKTSVKRTGGAVFTASARSFTGCMAYRILNRRFIVL